MSSPQLDRSQPMTDQLRRLGRRQGTTSRTPQYSRTAIVEILRQVEQGALVKDICRRYGITDTTFYRWRARYGQAVQAATPASSPEQQLRQAEAENRRLRKLLANLDRISA
jgi:putative transposase